ncbi:MAG: LutB/LldF family L-lactate oxidation iron-sulfur protein [Thermoleophilia bacterium]
MSSASRKAFDARVARTLGDPGLQEVLRSGQDYMQDLCEAAREELDWPAWLDAVGEVRRHTVAHLDHYVEQFAHNVEMHGGVVFCAADAAEAREYVAELARRTSSRLIVKSKSMVSEEIALNPALEATGAEVVETDLGEFIIQLCGERPFHIVGPAIHKSLEQIRALFSTLAGEELPPDPAALTQFARRQLREKFLSADMGITGANFGVADTGTIVLVTNEGNGRMTTTLPRTHVVVMGVERLVPDLEGLEPLLTVLPWQGVGQRITSYITAITGPRREGDADGPDELHVVLVDNGRSAILGSAYQDILHCIRCGACLDVCPVYRQIGGHAYDSTYSGPIGAVLSPLLEGLPRHAELPFASSLCGACSEVCSARIPLAEHLYGLRRDAVAQGLGSTAWRAGFDGFATATEHPSLFGLAERAARPLLRLFAHGETVRRGLGPLAAWTHTRDLRLPEPRAFRRLWRQRPPGQGGRDPGGERKAGGGRDERGGRSAP